MREKCFVQTKTILIDVNFLLWNKRIYFIQSEFLGRFIIKNFSGCGGGDSSEGQKRTETNAWN